MSSTLTEQHRQAQIALRNATLRALLRLWPALDVARLDTTFPAWAEAVGVLVARNRETSAGLASAYVQALRASKVGFSDFPLKLAAPAPAQLIRGSLFTTGVVPVRQGLAKGLTDVKARQNGFVLSSGAATRLVLQGGRETILDSIQLDYAAIGWRRVTDGSPCAFCALLASRGAVYKQDTSGFQSHGHCGCTAEPVYDKADSGPTTAAEPWKALYDQTSAANDGETSLLNAFRTAYRHAYGR